MSSWNPLQFLGLRRRGKDGDKSEDMDDSIDDSNETSPRTSRSGMELNRRGVPARKRKLNSLIYGADDLVCIPVKSPKKRGPKTPTKTNNNGAAIMDAEDMMPDDDRKYKKSPTKTPARATRTVKKRKASMKKVASQMVASIVDKPTSPVKYEPFDPELASPEKRSAQRLGVALRNLLKLPKGHRWVCHEFFYSNLDKVLFEGENDFMVCVRESFPQLKTRRLTRVEWCKIRRLMGKPRRCSPAFFNEERTELSRKRQKIRLLQQRKQTDFSSFKDLPDQIPLLLTIGARVTARLRKPQDGLFLGTVDAYDTSNNTYRIRFDRDGLGTQSVPDQDVVSCGEAETLPLSTFTMPKPRPRVIPNSPQNFVPIAPAMTSSYSPQVPANDPLLSGTTPKGKVMHVDGHVGGYPIRFLEQIVRLSKCLKKKREVICCVRDLNAQGERRRSFGQVINEDFQRRYASYVLELSHINRDLNEHLRNIREFTQEFAPEAGPTISLPNIIRESCQEDAYDMVNKNNVAEDREYVENPRVLSLVSSMTSLMCILHRLADGERNAYEVQALQDCLVEIKQGLNGKNLSKFENCVEVHMQHIQSGLSQMGNLRVFMMNPNSNTSQQKASVSSSSKVKVERDLQ